MQEKQSKHPLLKWILWKYVKILVIPLFPIILLNVNTLMSVIQNFNETLEPSLAQPTTDNVTVNHTPLKTIVDTMNQYIPIISLGLFVLAFMYAMSFITTLLYQRIKPDSRYFDIELYKKDVDKMTPVMFFILLTLSIMTSKM
jgi:hypothetical protein